MKGYQLFTESKQGFSIRQPNENCIVMNSWGNLIIQMVYDRQIEIWHRLEANEVPTDGSAFLLPTPKLRELLPK